MIMLLNRFLIQDQAIFAYPRVITQATFWVSKCSFLIRFRLHFLNSQGLMADKVPRSKIHTFFRA